MERLRWIVKMDLMTTSYQKEAEASHDRSSILVRSVQKFSDQIYEQILRGIVNGEMTEGQRLPSEQSLANAYGVSRPVVREALARLRADGIIVSRHGSGSYVRHQP